MFTIAKTFTFAASHILGGLPDGHPCGRLHGHNYEVTLGLRAETLNPAGMVLDYRALKPFRDFLDDTLDHRHLNDVVPGNPTAEIIARWLFAVAENLFGELVAWVEVRETPKTVARWEP